MGKPARLERCISARASTVYFSKVRTSICSIFGYASFINSGFLLCARGIRRYTYSVLMTFIRDFHILIRCSTISIRLFIDLLRGFVDYFIVMQMYLAELCIGANTNALQLGYACVHK